MKSGNQTLNLKGLFVKKLGSRGLDVCSFDLNRNHEISLPYESIWDAPADWITDLTWLWHCNQAAAWIYSDPAASATLKWM